MKNTYLRPVAAILLLMIVAAPVHGADDTHPRGIILDGTIGTAGKLNLPGPYYDIKAEYGQQAGANLFHSFQQFNVHSDEAAIFRGPDSVQNIIARVTGGDASWIDGDLVSLISGADLYLVNPAGMMFGHNASLYLDGSFHVSTADYLRMGENEQFPAMHQENELLSADAPAAFGFLDSDIAPVTFEGRGKVTEQDWKGACGNGRDCLDWFDWYENNLLGLYALDGNIISVIGGDIEMSKGTFFETTIDSVSMTVVLGNLNAINGEIHMAGLASAGEVVLTEYGPDVSSFEHMGNITLSEKSAISASGVSAGNIFIRSGRFVADDSIVEAETYGDKVGGTIDIQTVTFSLNNSYISASAYESGKGGNISVTASESVSLYGKDFYGEGSSIASYASGSGDGGDIVIKTRNLSVDDQGKIAAESAVIREHPDKPDYRPGNAGNIWIETDALTISHGGTISSEADNAGGGKVTIQADESLRLSDGTIGTSVRGGTDDAGDIRISDPKFVILNDSKIRATAHEGKGGNIRIAGDHFVSSSDSLVDASSTLGIDGSVEIESPDADISGTLMLLPSDFLPQPRIETCADKFGQDVIRFVISGRDGLPPSPDSFLSSPPLVFDSPATEELYHRGDFEQLALSLEQATNSADTEKETPDTLLVLAYAYQSLGYYQKALDKVFSVAKENHGRVHNALLFSSIGYLHLCLGNMEEAGKYLEKGVKQARLSENTLILASVLNNKGNFLALDNRDYSGAMSAYEESLGLIRGSEHGLRLKSKVLTNMARTGFLSGTLKSPDDALSHVRSLPDSHDKALDMVCLSLLIPRLEHGNPGVMCHRLLTHAKQISESLEDKQVASYANGYLGQLYEKESRYSEAVRLTRTAISFAQQGYYPEILYLWQWQLGRLFRAGGDIENSVKAYENAKETLNPIRREFFTRDCDRKDIFHKKIRPVYLELAELLLKQAETMGEDKLHDVRDTMEELKKAELEDFFRDECVTAMQRETMKLNRTPPHTALIYPIVFPDHVSILLTLPDGIRQIHVPADSGGPTVSEAATRFRRHLQNKSEGYKFYATMLYNWLIRPAENELADQEIDTLIVAPDGVLRLVPFSALYDEKDGLFLVQKYALATIPAITLTHTKTDEPEKARVLLSGLSEQADPPLPWVSRELKEIQEIMGHGRILLDREYTIDNLTREFENNAYSVVHISTHGMFGCTSDETFLSVYDGNLTMDRLEGLIRYSRFRDEKLGLLVLSACETALSDERAASGLAGVALKAGAGSAVGTLWSVNDEAAYLVVTEFYRQFRINGLSKAKALQKAQQKGIANQSFSHPHYWAPFLLIGNWM